MASIERSRADDSPLIAKPASLAQHIAMVSAWFCLALMAGIVEFPTHEECIAAWNSTLQWVGNRVKTDRVNTNGMSLGELAQVKTLSEACSIEVFSSDQPRPIHSLHPNARQMHIFSAQSKNF